MYYFVVTVHTMYQVWPPECRTSNCCFEKGNNKQYVIKSCCGCKPHPQWRSFLWLNPCIQVFKTKHKHARSQKKSTRLSRLQKITIVIPASNTMLSSRALQSSRDHHNYFYDHHSNPRDLSGEDFTKGPEPRDKSIIK